MISLKKRIFLDIVIKINIIIYGLVIKQYKLHCDEGKTALIFTAKSKKAGTVACFNLLLQEHSNVYLIKKRKGTYIIIIVFGSVNDDRSEINHKDNGHRTALWWARYSGNVLMIFFVSNVSNMSTKLSGAILNHAINLNYLENSKNCSKKKSFNATLSSAKALKPGFGQI